MNPFAYEPLDSPLARLGAPSKALFLICASTAAMRFGLPALIALLGSGIVLIAAFRVGAAGMGRPALALGAIVAFSALIRGMFPGDGRIFAAETLGASALYAARLAAVFVFARLYYASTKATELGDCLSLAARKAKSWFGGAKRTIGNPPAADSPTADSPAADPGMMLSLSLLFLPRVFEHYRSVREAAEIRGYGLKRRSIPGAMAMLQTFLYVSVRGALRTAQAMELRGYSPSRTIPAPMFKPADAAAAAAGLALLAAAFLGI